MKWIRIPSKKDYYKASMEIYDGGGPGVPPVEITASVRRSKGGTKWIGHVYADRYHFRRRFIENTREEAFRRVELALLEVFNRELDFRASICETIATHEIDEYPVEHPGVAIDPPQMIYRPRFDYRKRRRIT